MSKNTIYLIAAILILIVIAAIWAPKSPMKAPAASPANGLMDNTHAPVNLEKPSSEAVPPAVPVAPSSQPLSPVTAPDATVVPSNPTTPEVAEPPKDKAMDADDVPVDAEVAPTPTPGTAKPADDKGMVIPPSEGQ